MIPYSIHMQACACRNVSQVCYFHIFFGGMPIHILCPLKKKNSICQSAWMVQSVKHLALHLGGLDLRVMRLSLRGALSPSPSTYPHAQALSNE